MTEQELRIIADIAGCICGYMFDYCQEWCDENCGKVEDWECLKKYIEEKQNDRNKNILR